MAYSAGDTILDDEYNTFATGNAAGTGDTSAASINTILGTKYNFWIVLCSLCVCVF